MSQTGTKRALLIGINYSGSAQLYGCIQDVIQLQGVLIDAYGFKPEESVFCATMTRPLCQQKRVL